MQSPSSPFLDPDPLFLPHIKAKLVGTHFLTFMGQKGHEGSHKLFADCMQLHAQQPSQALHAFASGDVDLMVVVLTSSLNHAACISTVMPDRLCQVVAMSSELHRRLYNIITPQTISAPGSYTQQVRTCFFVNQVDGF